MEVPVLLEKKHWLLLVVFCAFSRSNLQIVRELGDRAAEGRACGNLGNTHYLLGNFEQAIKYHEEVCIIPSQSLLFLWMITALKRSRFVYFFSFQTDCDAELQS